jgi:hypothetical protein
MKPSLWQLKRFVGGSPTILLLHYDFDVLLFQLHKLKDLGKYIKL